MNEEQPDKAEKEIEKSIEEAEEVVEKEDKKDTKRLLIMIGIIIAIFFIFIASYMIFYSADKVVTIDELHKMNIEGKTSENNYMYNGYSFVYAEGMWYTQVQRQNKIWDIPLHFSPRDLENISLSGYINETFDKADTYITFNPVGKNLQYEALTSAELSLNMVKGLGVVPTAACDRNETETCANRPIITCKNTDKAVIYLKQAEPVRIEMKGNCIIIQGEKWDLLRAADKFILIWYGIIKP